MKRPLVALGSSLPYHKHTVTDFDKYFGHLYFVVPVVRSSTVRKCCGIAGISERDCS